MAGQVEGPRRPRGPKPTVTRELLLAAGRRAVLSRADDVSSRTLPLAVGVQLADVLDKAADLLRERGERRDKPVSAPVLYKHWPTFEAYVAELVPKLFDASATDTTILESGSDLVDAVASHALADRDQALAHELGVYFSLFRSAADPTVRDALLKVYADYDAAIVGALDAAIARAGRRAVDGRVERIAAALTALTEGLLLRSLVQPSVREDDALWSAAAVSVVLGMTEPAR